MKKLFCFILCFVMLLALVPTEAFGAHIASGNGWAISDDGTLYLTGKVTNPSTTSDETPWKDYKNQITQVVSHSTGSVSNCAFLFANCKNLKEVYISSLTTDNATSMASMYKNCTALTSVQISPNSEKVTDMSDMFYNCTALETVSYLWKLDTALVTDMSRMFYNCSSLKDLSLDRFNTSSAVNMNSMFYGCRSLTSIFPNTFNTEKVTDMANMFCKCSAAEYIDVSTFNTANVTDMSNMFSGCNNVTQLDVGDFDTTKVTNMSSMFSGCYKLKTLYVSKFNTANVTNMFGMFANCLALTEIDLSSFNTAKVSNMTAMLSNCSTLQTLDLSKITAKASTSTDNLFTGCSSLNTVTLSASLVNKTAPQLFTTGAAWAEKKSGLVYASADALPSYTETSTFMRASGSGWYLDSAGCLHIVDAVHNPSDTFMDKTPWIGCKSLIKTVIAERGSSVDNCNSLFLNCYNLTSLSLRWLDTSEASSMTDMFYNCSSLETVDLSCLDTSKVDSMVRMFDGCSKLTSVNFGSISTESLEFTGSMFYGCSSLETLDLSGLTMSNVKHTSFMFAYCYSLKSLDIGNLECPLNKDSVALMFDGCKELTEIVVNDKILIPNTAYQLLKLSDEWTNKADGTVYYDIDTLMAIDGKVTLMKGALTVEVSFNMGGHGTAPETQTVRYGNTPAMPEAPTAKGYIFGGWFTDSSYKTAFDFTKPVTENSTAFAKWTLYIPAGKGDLNFDGNINAIDSNMMKRILIGNLEPNTKLEDAADINSDGNINAIDSSLLLMMLIGG